MLSYIDLSKFTFGKERIRFFLYPYLDLYAKLVRGYEATDPIISRLNAIQHGEEPIEEEILDFEELEEEE